jgi:TPR repeat protein
MIKPVIACLLCFFLAACAAHQSPATQSYLQEGKRDFEGGYYRSAMRVLLPLACDGNAEAEYAVGYMYYYGYGVAQDTDVGTLWIERSAQKHYLPAVKALENVTRENENRSPHLPNQDRSQQQ